MPPPIPPPLPPSRTRTWWSRHWLWVAILGGILLVANTWFGSSAIMNWIARRVKDSEGYRVAMVTVRGDAQVRAALGEPVDDSGFIKGSFVETSHLHTIFAEIPLSGPKGRATLSINGAQADGPWHFQTLVVAVAATRATIDLRAAANDPGRHGKQP